MSIDCWTAAPGALGVKVTPIAQVAAPASVTPVHVSELTAKSPPGVVWEVIVTDDVPVFLSLINCSPLATPTWEVNVSAFDVGVIVIAPWMPVPDSGVVAVLASLGTDSVALTRPGAVGAKATITLQVAFAVSAAPGQVVDWMTNAAFPVVGVPT